jgi:DegV family protein with EDD domain
MQIVTDRAMDLALEQLEGFTLTQAPLRLTLDGITYKSGEDIQPAEFYKLLGETESFPTTSLPSAGEFAELYRQVARADPDILSIHISSGLSGTFDAARAGAAMVPEANVTFYDTLTLSCPEGWLVEAALHALRAGWGIKEITEMLNVMREKVHGMYTLPILKYLIHGGRISHLRGLVASMLNIKPIIGVDKITGKYISIGQEVTFRRAINKLAESITHWFPEGCHMRIQLLHGNNLEATLILRQRLEQLFQCTFMPTVTVAPVLGAHTGPGLVGMAFGPADLWKDIPS